MFGMGWAELLVCGLVGFFVFGPDRLPSIARDAARSLQKMRAMAAGVTDEMRSQLGPDDHLAQDLREMRQEFRDLQDLHPRRVVSRALFEQDGAAAAADAAPSGGAAGTRIIPGGTVPPYDLDAT